MITTHEELDALPEGTVILNWVGWLLVRQGGGWVYLDGGHPPKASEMVPAVVIEQPAPEPEPVKVASNARGRHLTHWQIKSSMQAQKIRGLQEETARLYEKLYWQGDQIAVQEMKIARLAEHLEKSREKKRSQREELARLNAKVDWQDKEITRLIIDRDQARSNNAFNTYQEKTAETAIYPGDQALEYLIPGLAAEAGEVAGKWAKIIRDQGSAYDQDDEDEIIKEVGDVLWMIARIAAELGVDLDVVAERNLQKLADRKKRGVLGGSGDHR